MFSMTKHKNWGGKRPGAGRPKYIRTIALDQDIAVLDRDTAQEIKILMLAEGRAYTPETVAAWIGTVVHSLWLAYDAEIQAAAEEAYEGGIL